MDETGRRLIDDLNELYLEIRSIYKSYNVESSYEFGYNRAVNETINQISNKLEQVINKHKENNK